MANVGRAEIAIVADVSRFGRNLQRNLQRAVDRIDIDTGNITRQISGAFRQGAADVRAAVGGMNEDVSRSLSETERSAARTGRRIGNSLRQGFGRVRDFFQTLNRDLFEFRTRIIAVTAAVVTATAAAIGALDELSALLLAAPAAAAVAAAAFGTFNVIVRGMSDAFEAAFEDTEAFEEAIAGLAPAAQAVAREFRALVPLFREIGINVQQAFWAQLDGTLTAVAENLAGPVQGGMQAVAFQMGRIAAEIGEFAATSETARTVALVFQATAQAMRNLVEATQPFLEGMRTLVQIFAPQMALLTRGAAEAAVEFRDWAAATQETGEALESFERAVGFLQTLGGILAGTSRLIEAAMDAASDAGVNLFQTIEQLIDSAAELAEGPQAQAGLQ